MGVEKWDLYDLFAPSLTKICVGSMILNSCLSRRVVPAALLKRDRNTAQNI